MRQGLMTPTELAARYHGGEITALKLSIEKWVRAGLRDNWFALTGNPSFYLEQLTCGLCKRHPGNRNCGDCCLKERGRKMGCGRGSQWCKAITAARRRDRLAFMRARRNLLTRMRRALAGEYRKRGKS